MNARLCGWFSYNGQNILTSLMLFAPLTCSGLSADPTNQSLNVTCEIQVAILGNKCEQNDLVI